MMGPTVNQDQVVFGAASLADLGVADTSALAAIVARSLGVESLEIQGFSIDEVPYDLVAITTRCRQRVSGTALVDGRPVPFSIFVKVVHSWAFSPAFASVPPPFREMAEQTLPWQVEPAAYESTLQTALPPGLRMPRTFAVRWLADRSAAIWIEDIDTDNIRWTTAHIRRAARLLGRFAASASVRAACAPLDQWISDRSVRDYANGRVAMQVIPALRGDELWAHPLVADHFGSDLRSRLLQLVDALPGLLDELDTLPAGVCHGDACTRNLLICRSEPDLVMIDFGFLRYAPLGIDLSQLVVGEIQLGERVPDELSTLSTVALEAFVEGLRQEGNSATIEQVARGHAITMAIFTGVSAIPFELLDEPPTDRVRSIFAARAAVARYILDQVGC